MEGESHVLGLFLSGRENGLRLAVYIMYVFVRRKKMTIKDLQIGETATIIEVGGSGALRQHFLDMGLIQGTEVTVVKYAPMGDPVELRIHGYELTIRLEDAGQIQVGAAHKEEVTVKRPAEKMDIPHPGLGEGGKFHSKADEKPLPDDVC